MVVPGNYKVSLSKFVDGKFTELISPQEFICRSLNNVSLPAKDKSALDNFNIKVAELIRAISGTDAYRKEMVKKIAYLKKAVFESSKVSDFKRRLKIIQSLTKDELKKLYLKELTEGEGTKKSGAGIGLIDISRESSKPIKYLFHEIDQNKVFFSIKITI